MIDKRMNLFRYILLTIFMVVSLFSLTGFLRIFLNYLFQLKPDKVSVEIQTSMLFLSIYIIFFVLSAFLFWGLLKKRRWFIHLYWIALFLWLCLCVWVLWPLNSSHFIADLIVFVMIIVLPLVIGVYMTKNKTALLRGQ
jgi:hypothetical protein